MSVFYFTGSDGVVYVPVILFIVGLPCLISGCGWKQKVYAKIDELNKNSTAADHDADDDDDDAA